MMKSRSFWRTARRKWFLAASFPAEFLRGEHAGIDRPAQTLLECVQDWSEFATARAAPITIKSTSLEAPFATRPRTHEQRPRRSATATVARASRSTFDQPHGLGDDALKLAAERAVGVGLVIDAIAFPAAPQDAGRHQRGQGGLQAGGRRPICLARSPRYHHRSGCSTVAARSPWVVLANSALIGLDLRI